MDEETNGSENAQTNLDSAAARADEAISTAAEAANNEGSQWQQEATELRSEAKHLRQLIADLTAKLEAQNNEPTKQLQTQIGKMLKQLEALETRLANLETPQPTADNPDRKKELNASTQDAPQPKPNKRGQLPRWV